MEKGGGGARAPGCPCAAWPPRPHPGRVRLSSCSSEVQTGPAGGGALGGRGVSVAAFLCTACPSTHSGHGLARVILAEALPVLDTCPTWCGARRRCPHSDAQGCSGKGKRCPCFTVGKAKVTPGGWASGPQSRGLEALGWRAGPLGQPSRVSGPHGLEALPRKRPDWPQTLPAGTTALPTPRSHRRKACDPGPGS